MKNPNGTPMEETALLGHFHPGTTILQGPRRISLLMHTVSGRKKVLGPPYIHVGSGLAAYYCLHLTLPW